jgi:hypothetical protein
MPINTDNAGSLIGAGPRDNGKRLVKFLKQTYVKSLERNSCIGETQYVSESDARFLIAYRYAKKVEPKEVVPVEHGEPEVSIEEAVQEHFDSGTENDEAPDGEPNVETVQDDPEQEVHRYSRRRRKRGAE